MRQTAAAGAMLIFLVSLSACGANEAASGTVAGTVVVSPPCPVEMSPLTPPSGTSASGSSEDTCTGAVPSATVKAFIAGSEDVAASVPTTSDGRFRHELPEGNYRLEAVPDSPSAGHGVPLDVEVKADSTVEVTLRIDTGVQ